VLTTERHGCSDKRFMQAIGKNVMAPMSLRKKEGCRWMMPTLGQENAVWQSLVRGIGETKVPGRGSRLCR